MPSGYVRWEIYQPPFKKKKKSILVHVGIHEIHIMFLKRERPETKDWEKNLTGYVLRKSRTFLQVSTENPTKITEYFTYSCSSEH